MAEIPKKFGKNPLYDNPMPRLDEFEDIAAMKQYFEDRNNRKNAIRQPRFEPQQQQQKYFTAGPPAPLLPDILSNLKQNATLKDSLIEFGINAQPTLTICCPVAIAGGLLGVAAYAYEESDFETEWDKRKEQNALYQKARQRSKHFSPR